MKRLLALLVGLSLLCGKLFAASPDYNNFDIWGFNKSGFNIFINTNNIATRAWVLSLGGGGSGSLTNFSAGNFSPLFTTSVANPTTNPSLTFNPIGQNPNLVFASPASGIGFPSFRALVPADLPGGGSGSVTNFSSGNLSPLFTTSVSSPTLNPTLSYTLIPQNANTFYAGPTTGSSANPTFRSLVTADLPFSIGNFTDVGTDGITVTGGTGSTIGSGTSISQHIADATHNGYLGAADWTAFNNKQGPLTLGNLTAAGTDGISVTGGSGAVVGAGTSIAQHVADATHNGYLSSSDWSLFHTGGTSTSSGVDIVQTNLAPLDGATNFVVDFNWAAQVANPTGAIYFNYATNWGLVNTSRVARIYVPATNYYRHVYYTGLSTNWQEAHQTITGIPTGYGAKFEFQIFGQGDSNVVYTARVDDYPISTNYTLTVGGFNPTNSQGGCVLWLEGSNGKYSEELTNTSPAAFGQPVRWWSDLSLFVPRMTNAGLSTSIFNANPNNVPGNIPSINWTPTQVTGGATLSSPTFSVVSQPNWAFMVWYGRPGQFVFLDGNAEGNRFGCALGEGGITAQIYAGSSLNAATPQSPIYEWRVFSYCENSTTSIIRTNGVLAVQGNAGTQAPTRWVVGSDYNGAAFGGFGYLAELLVYHTNLSNVQITNVENYLKFKYGVKVP